MIDIVVVVKLYEKWLRKKKKSSWWKMVNIERHEEYRWLQMKTYKILESILVTIGREKRRKRSKSWGKQVQFLIVEWEKNDNKLRQNGTKLYCDRLKKTSFTMMTVLIHGRFDNPVRICWLKISIGMNGWMSRKLVDWLSIGKALLDDWIFFFFLWIFQSSELLCWLSENVLVLFLFWLNHFFPYHRRQDVASPFFSISPSKTTCQH